jgi:hypothetical protein
MPFSGPQSLKSWTFASASAVLKILQDPYYLLIRLEPSQGLASQRLSLDLIEPWTSRNKLLHMLKKLNIIGAIVQSVNVFQARQLEQLHVMFYGRW